jgi:hypothetical protein
MTGSLLNAFSSLDAGIKEALADLSSPRAIALAVLLIAADKLAVNALTAEHVIACAEAAGVAMKRLSVARALANARGAVAMGKNDEGDTTYKIMIKGRREIESTLGGNRVSVVRIESNQPRSARLKLQEILALLRGDVSICDPYYGVRTLDVLDMIPKACRVRFLTAHTNETGRQLQGAITDFKRERPRTEIRTVPRNAGIHDRYIVSSVELILLGHGLKDIGGKESFMIRLDASLVPDLVQETIRAFDTRWNQAAPI